MSLKDRIHDDMKTALRAGEKERLGVIRMAMAAIKQIEVDTRKDLSDADVLGIVDKMVKQRRESISQFRAGAREDLAEKEQAEIEILGDYLPEPLSEAELDTLIKNVIESTQAQSMKDMGKVMGQIKSAVQGRADMGAVSAKIKSLLTG